MTGPALDFNGEVIRDGDLIAHASGDYGRGRARVSATATGEPYVSYSFPAMEGYCGRGGPAREFVHVDEEVAS